MIKLPVLLAVFSLSSHASVIFGPISYSDNNGGGFLSGSSATASGNSLHLLLPSFAQSNFAIPSPGEVDFAFSVSSTTAITSVTYIFSGAFTGAGQGSYAQTIGAQNDGATFGSPTITNTLSLPANTFSANLTTILQLFDNGDSASINDALFTLTTAPASVPEPSTMILLGVGAGLLLLKKLKRQERKAALAVAAICGLAALPASAQQGKQRTEENDRFADMSSMGRLAKQVSARLKTARVGGKGIRALADSAPPKIDQCENEDEDCSEDGYSEGPGGGQAELAIGVDPTNQHIVVGYNDTRGFSGSPVTLSGFAYSDNGGLTFTDGGRLPNGPTTTIGTTLYPQIYGDPDIKFVPGGGGCQFIYSSIMVKAISATATAQTMALHRSTDCGHTWQGPFEVTAATAPHTGDAADKELIDVDPETNRVLISWSNFTATSVEIRTAYSDNIMAGAPPTWSAGVVIATGNFQGSVPRFVGNGSTNAYVAYSNGGTNIGFSRSTDNGLTWSTPINVSATSYITPDQIIGSDRIHSFPTMGVDNSTGPTRGTSMLRPPRRAQIQAARMSLSGGARTPGLTFGPGKLVDPNPVIDRPQWFPFIAVDTSTGRVNIMYDDQHVAPSGDFTEMTRTYSDDGGTTFSPPTPLTQRPFHADYGNDSGQPNIGDYNAAVAQTGTFYAAFATTPNQGSFVDLQPSGSFSYPSFLPNPNPVGFAKVTGGKAAISLGTVALTDSGGNGFVDAGRSGSVQTYAD